MENRPKLYASVAFVAGVLVCLGFKDLYPDLERRYRRRYGFQKTVADGGHLEDGHIDLEDHEKQKTRGHVDVDMPEGIEACIGNTPLFKIKSLSEATGCDILAKAEVTTLNARSSACCLTSSTVVSKWSRRQS